MGLIRLLFKVIISLLVATVVALMSVYLFAPNWLAATVAERIELEGLSQGVIIKISEPALKNLHLMAKSIQVQSTVPLVFEEPDLLLSFDILEFQPYFLFTAKTLGGSLRAEGRISFSGDGTITVQGNDFSPTKLQHFAILGVTEGKVSGQVSNLRLIKGEIASAGFRLELNGFKREKLGSPLAESAMQRSILAGGANLNPMVLSMIPSVKDLNLVLQGAIKNSLISLDEASLTSSLGDAKASGYWNFSQRFQDCVSASFKGLARLSSVGVEDLGAMLSLATGGRISSKTPNFRFSGSGCKPEMIYDPLRE